MLKCEKIGKNNNKDKRKTKTKRKEKFILDILCLEEEVSILYAEFGQNQNREYPTEQREIDEARACPRREYKCVVIVTVID